MNQDAFIEDFGQAVRRFGLAFCDARALNPDLFIVGFEKSVGPDVARVRINLSSGETMEAEFGLHGYRQREIELQMEKLTEHFRKAADIASGAADRALTNVRFPGRDQP